ncbi:MAG: DUF2059 domain-containing protein [Pseudomonadota bacterium]
MRRAALAILLATALGPVAAALPAAAQSTTEQTVPADEDFEASHLRAAQNVISLIGGDVTFDDILPRIANQTRAVFTRTNPALTREIEVAVNEAALAMVPRRIELSKTLQLIWARRFSEEELNQLAEFFNGPLGSKYVEMFPIVSALALGASKQYEQVISAEMVNETRDRLREAGHTL